MMIKEIVALQHQESPVRKIWGAILSGNDPSALLFWGNANNHGVRHQLVSDFRIGDRKRRKIAVGFTVLTPFRMEVKTDMESVDVAVRARDAIFNAPANAEEARIYEAIAGIREWGAQRHAISAAAKSSADLRAIWMGAPGLKLPWVFRPINQLSPGGLAFSGPSGVLSEDLSNSWSARRNTYRLWARHLCGSRQHTPSIKWLNPWIASVGSPHSARTTAPSIAMATALAQSSRSQFAGSRPSITLRSSALC